MKKLLIIDDSKTVLQAVKSILDASDKFKAYYAQSYAEATVLLDSRSFFAAIVDLELPDCEAGAAAELTLNKQIPTIVLTATMNAELRQDIIKKPIVDYIIKNSIEDIASAVAVANNLLLFEGQRALIVDDSKTSRDELKLYLHSLAFDVIEAESSEQALGILANDKNFQLILLDYEMPNMNGVKLLQSIRKMIFDKPPLIFGVSGSGDNQSVRIQFLKSGAYHVFAKPLLKEEFNTKLSNAMRLLKDKEQLQELVDTVDKYVIISATDLSGKIIYASEAFCTISGYTKEELLGENHRIVRHEDMPASLYKELWETIGSGQSWSGEVKNKKKDGNYYWVNINIDPINDRQGHRIGYRAIRQDITDKKKVEELAITDRLTQIYNRLHLDEVLEKELLRSQRYEEPLSVIIIDVDHFKKVNDTFGHQVGDSVLVAVANILKQNIRATDTLGRWGGEEFLVISPETGINGAKELAEKLRCAIEAYEFESVGHKTASFGVSSYHVGDSEESLMKRADDALYAAKTNGRNRVEVEA